jgi:hypothetical protein
MTIAPARRPLPINRLGLAHLQISERIAQFIRLPSIKPDLLPEIFHTNSSGVVVGLWVLVQMLQEVMLEVVGII